MAGTKGRIEPICPYCKAVNFTSGAIGTSGLINQFGMKAQIRCRTCEKDFECDVEVNIRYSTTKIAE
jgi:hypothetical protein